ncbi:MAG TPA: hypothetical protein VJ850_13845 [Candidatus Limnocylindrales bacterium]|nr:hypothetical protein [Candidatus Limnocylindrales bacterium]
MAKPRIGRVLRLATFGAVAALVVVAASVVATGMRSHGETQRTTPRYDPPVWAGQNVPGPCASGGFYAREGRTIVLTIAAHCPAADLGATMLDPNGRLVGTYGPLAELADCPPGRFCAPADILALRLPAARIPWGHLNLVDLGAGGYRTLDPGTVPMACADVRVGDRVELDGREIFRSGKVLEIGRYEHETDTIFPCMVVTDIGGDYGDSGSAVLVNGRPAGTVSRLIAGYLAFTPLAEGLRNLGLELCTTPDCDLQPGSS